MSSSGSGHTRAALVTPVFPPRSPDGARLGRGRDGADLGRFAAEAAQARSVLAPFSTRLPPELIDRLRIAAPQLRLHQGEIAAIAIDRYLNEHGH